MIFLHFRHRPHRHGATFVVAIDDMCELEKHTGDTVSITMAAQSELKSATSLTDAGMADCRVRMVGEAGSDGWESNSLWLLLLPTSQMEHPLSH